VRRHARACATMLPLQSETVASPWRRAQTPSCCSSDQSVHRVQQSMQRAVVLLTLLGALPPHQHVHAARARSSRAQATAAGAEDGAEPTPSHQVLMEQREQHHKESPSAELETALVALEEAVEGEQHGAPQIQPTSQQPEQATVSTSARL
jgi:hypothetical protein